MATPNKLNSKRHSLVSVIMPALNAEKYIEESISSVIKQSYKNLELLIIDDGSTDRTASIVSQMVKDDNRIIYLKNPGKGVSAARNVGIKNAQGDYITFLDSDDIYHPDAVKLRAEYLDNNENVKAVFCEIRLTDPNLKGIGWVIPGKSVVTFPDFHGNAVQTPTLMFRSDIIKRVGFDESFTNGEDWLCWQRIARMGVEYYLVSGCHVLYRQHNSTVLRNYKHHENQLLRVIDILYGIDPDCPEPDPRYHDGLKTPPKETVLIQRRLQLFFFLLNQYDFDNAIEIGQELSTYNFDNINVQAMFSALRIATVRSELCHMTLWEYRLNAKKNHIEPYLRKYLPDDKISAVLNMVKKPLPDEKDALLAKLQANLEKVLSETSSLTNLMSGKDSQISSLTNLLSEKDSQISSLTNLLTEKDKIIESNTIEIRSLATEKEKGVAEILRHVATIKETEGLVKQQEVTVRNLLAEITRNKLEQKKLRDSLEKQRNESSAKDKALASQQEQIENLESAIQLKQQEFETARAALQNQLQNKMADVQRLESIHTTSMEKLELYQQETSQLKTEIAGLEVKLKLSDTTLSDLQKKNSALLSKSKETESIVARLKETLSQKEKQIAELKELIRNIEKSYTFRVGKAIVGPASKIKNILKKG